MIFLCLKHWNAFYREFILSRIKFVVLKPFMLLSFLVFSVSAVSANWLQGHYDISWYKPSQSEFVLTTPQQLAGMAYLVNQGYTDFAKKTIKLGTDISLKGHNWVAVNKFCGIFDGQGYTISDLFLADGVYPHYGFWSQLNNASIKNLEICGRVQLIFTDMGYPNTYAGAFAGLALNSNFENCKSSCEITYKRYDDNCWKYYLYIGGMLGKVESCTFLDCVNTGSLYVGFCDESSDGGAYESVQTTIGGLVGSASYTPMKRCGNESRDIEVSIASSKNDGGAPVSMGGLIGSYFDGRIVGCYNNCNEFKLYYGGGKYRYPSIGGIVGSFTAWSAQGIFNCYSSTNTAHTIIPNSHSILYYGVVGQCTNGNTFPERYVGCFFPSDWLASNLESIGTSTGWLGSTAYSKNLMMESAFLDELNLYPQLNDEDYIWVKGRTFPRPVNKEMVTSVHRVEMDKSVSLRYYSIDGLPLDEPRQGINIIRYSDGRTEKILVE